MYDYTEAGSWLSGRNRKNKDFPVWSLPAYIFDTEAHPKLGTGDVHTGQLNIVQSLCK